MDVLRKDGLFLDRYEDMPDVEDIVEAAEAAGDVLRHVSAKCHFSAG